MREVNGRYDEGYEGVAPVALSIREDGEPGGSEGPVRVVEEYGSGLPFSKA